jgi:hypothetical protein
MHPNEYPREEAVCALFARRIEPALGFVAYGVIWFFVAGGLTAPVMLSSTWLLVQLTGPPPIPVWAVVLIMLSFVGTFLFSWWLFFRWVWRRRRRARQFFMEGVFAECTIMGHSLIRLPRSRPLVRSAARFTVDDEIYLADLIEARPDFRPIGSFCTILFSPNYPLVVVFEEDGTFISASWRRADT